ncbi:hypothetical protein DJ021_04455 [Phenylobacterium hankyongense]|uniref:TonB C-terminal domain-containing protein n=1 Tax=Phenylobacterium hankyongense TaxID=1813876 RepID=A0A328AVU0_9CAUL|nr:TonB family protein [Phenylobacterium hankyongense]RAK59103.1 hypothetical protein DJ021_04455 [Phenylobacterium hankyongense]
MRWRSAVIILALGSVAAAAHARPPSRWIHHPSNQELINALPAETVRQGFGGAAIARCKVDAGGRLSACRLVHETPAGHGYGAALLALAPAYQLSPAAAKAEAVDGEVMLAEDWYRQDTPADWLRKPTPADMLVVWPTQAWAKGLGGRAIIACQVTTQGALLDCVTLSEKPAGEHFGAAAIALTPQFLMKPATLKGAPVVSMVNIPINFEAPGGPRRQDSFGSRKVVDPSIAWPEAPSHADVVAAYPAKARASGAGGRATLDCSLEKDGRLQHCSTVSEQPRGQGFAEAAKALAKRFRANPLPPKSGPASVQLPFTFDPAMLASGEPVIGKPQWASLPSVEDTNGAFKDIKATGDLRVTLKCKVQPGGTVAGCTAQNEQPAASGLAAAALALAPKFRLATWTVEGLPTIGGVVTVPILYRVGNGAPAAKPAP